MNQEFGVGRPAAVPVLPATVSPAIWAPAANFRPSIPSTAWTMAPAIVAASPAERTAPESCVGLLGHRPDGVDGKAARARLAPLAIVAATSAMSSGVTSTSPCRTRRWPARRRRRSRQGPPPSLRDRRREYRTGWARRSPAGGPPRPCPPLWSAGPPAHTRCCRRLPWRARSPDDPVKRWWPSRTSKRRPAGPVVGPRLLGVVAAPIAPDEKPAIAVTILKTEPERSAPGSRLPGVVRAAVDAACDVAGFAIADGSKVGVLAIARTSPVRGRAPRPRSAPSRRTARRWSDSERRSAGRRRCVARGRNFARARDTGSSGAEL